jgi:hypothetical protein
MFQALFQSAQHLYEKREGSGSLPLTNGSVRPKSMRIRILNTNKKLKVGFLLLFCIHFLFPFMTDILHFFLTYCYELTHLNLHLNCASFMSTSFLKSLLALNPLLSLQRFALTAPTQLGTPLTFLFIKDYLILKFEW